MCGRERLQSGKVLLFVVRASAERFPYNQASMAGIDR